MTNYSVKLSANGAEKWLNCSGSVILEAQMPKKEMEYEKEAITAHALGKAKLQLAMKEITTAKYNKAILELEKTQEMEGFANEYRDFVMERFNLAKGKNAHAVMRLEQRLDFSAWVFEGFATANGVIIAEGTMEVIDFDYSKEAEVKAENNPKLRLYALGALTEFDYLYGIKSITVTAFQPRMNNISTYPITAEELLVWANTKVMPMAKKAMSGAEEYCVGKHCDNGFCHARPICRAYADKKSQLTKYDFKQPSALSLAEIAHILQQSESLAKWSAMVKDFALDQAVNYGVIYPGYKVVEGRSNRMWAVDETLIAAQLIGKGYGDDDIWPRKLKGITALEQFLSKKTFNHILGDLVVKPQGKPTLVPLEDKRLEMDFQNRLLAEGSEG